jgi:hypothetical protein
MSKLLLIDCIETFDSTDRSQLFIVSVLWNIRTDDKANGDNTKQ